MPSKVTKKDTLNLLVDNLVFNAIKNEDFPGAGLCVIKNGQILLNKVYGYSEKIPRHQKMTQKTLFDVASLTKPIATATLYMLAYQEGKIDLDETVDSFVGAGLSRPFSGAKTAPLQLITLRHLLNHTSGLPDYREYYKIEKINKKALVQKILSEKLSKPGEKVLYSDLGYILLGAILEKIYDASLDELFEEKIARPLELRSTFFHPLPVSLSPQGRGTGTGEKKYKKVPFPSRGEGQGEGERFAATEYCQFRKRMIIGEVMDENCFAMGGVAGHAGLFSTCEDISKWLLELRKAKDGKSLLIDQKTFRVFCQVPLKEQESRRAGEPGRHRPDRFFTLGFETPSHPSSSGKYFSSNSLGHLGYTGTSFWWDVEKDWMVILLTNRVHPTRENKKIQEFRPKLHDLVVESLLDAGSSPSLCIPPPSRGREKEKEEMTHSKNETQIRCGFPDDF